jgi:hypothetical protein
MNAFLALLGLMLLLALGCTALVLVAIILSLVPPELEDPQARRTGQSSERGPRRGWRALWLREDRTGEDGSWPAQALHRLPSNPLHPRGRPR